MDFDLYPPHHVFVPVSLNENPFNVNPEIHTFDLSSWQRFYAMPLSER